MREITPDDERAAIGGNRICALLPVALALWMALAAWCLYWIGGVL